MSFQDLYVDWLVFSNQNFTFYQHAQIFQQNLRLPNFIKIILNVLNITNCWNFWTGFIFIIQYFIQLRNYILAHCGSHDLKKALKRPCFNIIRIDIISLLNKLPFQYILFRLRFHITSDKNKRKKMERVTDCACSQSDLLYSIEPFESLQKFC